MADDAKHIKRRPVALGQAISGFCLLSTGSGSRGKKKGRLPDGSGPQRDRHPPGIRSEGRAIWPAAPGEPTKFAGPMKQQEPPARCRRPRPRWQPFCLASAQTIAAPVPATTVGSVAAGQGGSFSLHPRRPSLRGGVKSETVVELFCRKSPGGVSHLPQRPQRSSPCLIRPPSRRGLSAAVFPAVWIPALVSFVLACGGASFAPTPRLLGASLPLRRYVRRGGVGTWPRGAVFPAFPVVHEDILQK